MAVYHVSSPGCPAWCTAMHGVLQGEDDHVHVGGRLLVRETALRLCATVDPRTGATEGPFVLVGSEEYTLHEAEAMAAALTQLVDQGRASFPAQRAEGALPVGDAQLAQHGGHVDADSGR